MKLLIIGPDIRERETIKNFTGVYAFYLMRELRLRGVELFFVDGKPADPLAYFQAIDVPGCDHALALGLRWFTHQPPGLARLIATRVGGAVTQLHDGLVHEWLDKHMDGVTCTFTFRDDSARTKDWSRYATRYCHIGWAADPNLFFPAQLRGELRILIDHPYYKAGQPDCTQMVSEDAVGFAYTSRWRNRFRSIRVRRLVNGGAEDVTLANIRPAPFTREHVSLDMIAPEYRHTYVFMPTHKESVGLTCLETAMCGALTVAPKGLIHQDRLDTIRHLTYEGGRAPWQQVLDACDFKASSCKAREQTWGRVADRLLAWFGSYK